MQYQLEKKVLFFPRMPYQNMIQYTQACDIGLTFDKDTNLNYRFSLPNKIFDYIHAGIPVLAYRLPEIEKIITNYSIGSFIENHNPSEDGKLATSKSPAKQTKEDKEDEALKAYREARNPQRKKVLTNN